MKKISILFLGAAVATGVSLTSCSKQSTAGSSMKTSTDSLSYAYGVGMGSSLQQNLQEFPTELNLDLFLAVFEKALKGDTANLAISPDEAYEVFQRCMATAQTEAAAVTKKEAAEAEVEIAN